MKLPYPSLALHTCTMSFSHSSKNCQTLYDSQTNVLYNETCCRYGVPIGTMPFCNQNENKV